MKKVLIFGMLILGIASMQSCASVKTIVSEPTIKVVKLEGKTQNELYIRANTWMVETFHNAESVIQFSDKQNGIVTGKYLLSSKGIGGSGMSATWKNVYAIIKIQVKDGASKITITPDSFGEGGDGSNKQKYTEVKMKNDINLLVESFSKAIKTTESNDW